MCFCAHTFIEMRGTALCLFDHVRDPHATAPSLRRHVAHLFDADVFLHLISAARASPTSHVLIDALSPIDVSVDERDWTQSDFAADLQPLTNAYLDAIISSPGLSHPLSPLGCEQRNAGCPEAARRPTGAGREQARHDFMMRRCCAACLHTYRSQSKCLAMIRRAELRRGVPYRWVIATRGELRWLSNHPPLTTVLTEDRIWVPSCRNDWGGIYDRHAALPRKYADAYLGRYDEIKNGSALLLGDDFDAVEEIHNPESHLALHLDRHRVPIGRFPCVAALVCCGKVSSSTGSTASSVHHPSKNGSQVAACFSDGCCHVASEPHLAFKTYGKIDDCGEGESAVAQAQCLAKGQPWRPLSRTHRCPGLQRDVLQSLAMRDQKSTASDGHRGALGEPYVSSCSDPCAPAHNTSTTRF